MNLYERFQQFILQEKLFSKHNKLLLAVSGGIDSVVLCHLLHQGGYDFSIAHCNFRLRGEESERDEKFVQDLADRYEVRLFVKHFDTSRYAELHKVSIQVAARELRYAWFREIIEEVSDQESERRAMMKKPVPPAFIVTAHHADDNIETMMMNFFKGTGVTGLRGILPKQGNLVRPLLFAQKEELTSFARENQLQFVEDSSNISDKYTRNYFRNQLIPGLEKVFPSVKANLVHNLKRFRETELLYLEAIAGHQKKLVETRGNELHIPVLKLLNLPYRETILFEILRPYGFSPHQVTEAVHLLETETGKYVQSASYRVIRNRAWLIITPVNTETSNTIVIEKDDSRVLFATGSINIRTIEAKDYPLIPDSSMAALDLGSIEFPLILRKWKKGDYFYPLGLRKKKKISRFLIDIKLSLPEKENTWVVEMNKKIIWVVNRRIDDRFKLTDQTANILELKFITGS